MLHGQLVGRTAFFTISFYKEMLHFLRISPKHFYLHLAGACSCTKGVRRRPSLFCATRSVCCETCRSARCTPATRLRTPAPALGHCRPWGVQPMMMVVLSQKPIQLYTSPGPAPGHVPEMCKSRGTPLAQVAWVIRFISVAQARKKGPPLPT